MIATVERIEAEDQVYSYDGQVHVTTVRIHFRWPHGEGSVVCARDSQLALGVRVGDELDVEVKSP